MQLDLFKDGQQFYKYYARTVPLYLLFLLVLLPQALPVSSAGPSNDVAAAATREKCRSNVCFNEGECFVTRGGGRATKFFCECRRGFAGLLCELKCELRCQNGGKCQKLAEKGEFCECPGGFRGPLCAENDKINAEQLEDCRHNARACPFAHVCLQDPESGEFHCERNQCLRWGQSPCANNATCRPIKDDFVCECPAGFHGRHCADDIDECLEANVGRSAEGDAGADFVRGPCQNGGECVNTPGTFECQCAPGYEGSICQNHIGACAKSPCGERGTCKDMDNNGTYECNCYGNFTGKHCETECQPPRVLVTHLNESGAHAALASCICPPGKMGENCELHVTPCSGEDARGQCQNGGQCVPAGSKAFCICPTGFSGPTCEQRDVNADEGLQKSSKLSEECTVNGRKCQNGGRCEQRRHGHTGNFSSSRCQCSKNFTGTWCERTLRHDDVLGKNVTSPPTDFCSPNPCLNDGKCLTKENGPLCECPVGRFAGAQCQLKCHCSPGELCAESEVQRGIAECFQQNQTPLTPSPQTQQTLTSTLPPPSATDSQTESGDDQEEDEADQEDIVDENFDTFVGWSNETTVSNCTACANGAKCVRIADRIRCLCGADYAGAQCDVKKPLCDSLMCHKPGELCQPVRGVPGKKDEARCECPPGMGGKKCSLPNTMGFTNVSVVLLQSARNKNYFLTFGFRTTLPTVHLASGENLLGQIEYTLRLQDGIVQLRVDTNGTEQFTELEVPIRVNDDDWYQLTLWSTRKRGTAFELWHPETGFLLARHLLSSGQKLANVWTTRLGQQRGDNAPFIGCMRAVALNGAEPIRDDDQGRAINVQSGCHRHEQCSSTVSSLDMTAPCANGGVCLDLWDKFVCRCPRPFLPPRCVEQPQEATFGHGGQPSNCLYALSSDDKSSVAERTHTSFLLRTSDHRGGGSTPTLAMPLVYLGESAGTNAEPDTSTFLAVELRNGVPRLNARLGGKQVYSVNATERVDDGKVHLVELDRVGNLIKLKVDDGKWHSVRIARSFEHPLLADQLFVGALPSSNLPIAAFVTGNMSDQYFKGTLQDLRINDRLVPFFNHLEDKLLPRVPLFGHKLADQNLLQGTVSDDVCATHSSQKPCGAHGTCVNTFNNFECRCTSGWMGLRCKQRDFCGNSTNGTTKFCPEGTECQNVQGGFVCTSTASLFTSSSLRYTIRQLSEGVDKSKIGNFTLEIRTRTRNGHLLKLQSSNYSLILQLKNGVLQLSSGNANFTSTEHNSTSNITDGQWHRLMIRQNSKGNSIILFIDNVVMRLGNALNFSLAHFATDKLARISFGRMPEQDGFKGCLRNVRLSPFPPLIFYPPQKVPKIVEAMASAQITHFELQHHENVVPNGCQSSNVCAKNPCLNGGTCEDQWNAMRCQCARGFAGENCELNQNECELRGGHAVCAPNGKCVDAPNGFRCVCANGFSGPKCSDANELCRPGTCQNGEKCRTVNGTTTECECGPKHIGAWCQLDAGIKCSEEPCQNEGRCFQSAHGQVGCWCKPGFTGPLCELRVDPCRTQPCANGGKCVPVALSPSNANNSTTTTAPSFHCECAREFEGTLCERLADACARIGAREPCGRHGKCENIWGGHRCTCDRGWRGRDCSVRVDKCAEEAPCVNGGTCVDQQNGTDADFRCQCPPFYRGDRWQAQGETYACRCARGFRGKRCEQRVDVCSEQEPCQNGGTCVPLQQSDDFRCACIAGFTGKKCEVDIDECAAKPCLHGGRCFERVNSFECDCHGTGYKGLRCEQDVDECAAAAANAVPQHCVNGVCTNSDGDYHCECRPGYIGKRCHMANPCVPNPLTNRTRHNCAHGRCVRPRVQQAARGEEFVQHECECAEGFTGELCMHLVEPQHQLSLSNFIGAGVVVIVLCICLGALLYFFAVCARRKRAFQGTYSPSNQELVAQARLFSQRQFQRQPLHRNQLSSGGGLHKTRRKF
uniref:Protein crumbs n=1 Tax=Globodera rostochiensis TaxID=31243 RepID=A0A914HPZ6_GLORO